MEPTVHNVVEEQLQAMTHGIMEYLGEDHDIAFPPFTTFSGIPGAWICPIVLKLEVMH